ncbi:extracellular solute-binding protein [Actinorugispora endophytica]|uniref:Carbohydrate ABC transporter substrate-binding protein (CUT1 family) n=1 Tax=Actinorugispora endophytica TaxID=1605990 RepID=A0A4R6V6Z3_9ACTN|nr:extracellular solute-binding protein [Actinorugispora endophytica]TDQ52031.1 carbohydrate ABC transporter substrate-binding protein (CUT1 family) [Actinorugispora endophytica]
MRRAAGTPPSPSRRSLLAGTLAAAGLGLAGCGPADSVLDDRTRLRQWNLFTGGDGARMVEMHERYTAEHPDIDFRPTTYLWGDPFYTKFAMGAAGGRASDIATLHLSRLANMAPGRLIDPIDEGALAEAGISGEVLPPDIWERCFVDGALYAVPLDTHVVVTYYNREVCRSAGVLDAGGRLVETRGVAEFVDLLTEVKAVTGEFGTVLDTTNPWQYFWAMYRQQDGRMVFGDDDFEMDDDKALAALDVLRRLSEEGLAPRSSDAPGTPPNFANGRGGLGLMGNWEIPTFETAGMDFSVTQFPDLFGNHRTRGDSHVYVLPHQRERDPEVTAAAVEYAAWMLRNSLTWAGGGHIPAYRPVVESEEYLAMRPQSEYREAAGNVELDPDIWFSGSAARLSTEATAVFSGLHQGTTTPEESLTRFKDAVRALVRVPAPI